MNRNEACDAVIAAQSEYDRIELVAERWLAAKRAALEDLEAAQERLATVLKEETEIAKCLTT